MIQYCRRFTFSVQQYGRRVVTSITTNFFYVSPRLKLNLVFKMYKKRKLNLNSPSTSFSFWTPLQVNSSRISQIWPKKYHGDRVLSRKYATAMNNLVKSQTTNNNKLTLHTQQAFVAQWLEHWSCKPGVESSNLSRGLNFSFLCFYRRAKIVFVLPFHIRGYFQHKRKISSRNAISVFEYDSRFTEQEHEVKKTFYKMRGSEQKCCNSEEKSGL